MIEPMSDAELFDKTVRETPGVWFVAALLAGGVFIFGGLYFGARLLWALTACVA